MDITLTESEYDGRYVGVPVMGGFFGLVIGQASINGRVRFAVMDDSNPDIPEEARRIRFMTGDEVERYTIE